MEITLAKSAGFCFGVNRAVNLVYGLLDRGSEKVCTLGPIIHNPQVVRDLCEKGVSIVTSPSQAPAGSTLVIRSHGVPRNVYEEIGRSGLEYVDATCPFVSRIHKIVNEHSDADSAVLIAGDEAHPEVEGIKSYCSGDVYTFNNLEELKNIRKNHPELDNKRILVVSQTTFHVQEWELCVCFIKKAYTNVIIFDTICDATSIRQQEAKQIAGQSDIMIVIGGKESSNTAKLFSVCSQCCPSVLIEDAGELPYEKICNVSKVGVTAGASTPARIIKEVLKKMSDVNEAQNAELNFAEALEKSFKTITTGDRVRGVVIGFTPTEVQIDIGTKQAGYVPLSEFTDNPNTKPEELAKIGDELDLAVLRVNDVDGTAMLSKRRVDAIRSWEEVVKASEDASVLSGTVTEVVNGGVLAAFNGVKIFIPASQSGVMKNENLDVLLHKPVQFRIIDINTQRKRAVGSIRSVLKDERKKKIEEFWSNVEIGKEYTGKVKSLTSYGAFVDLGGVDGMIHVSEISWARIKQPSDVLKIGDVVTVRIKDINPETRKVSLSYRKEEDNPWNKFIEQYKIGDIVDAKIVSFMTFGAFAQIIPGVDGLIHISQISDQHVVKPQDVLKNGEIVKVKITNIEPDRKRISLSMKEAAAEAAAYPEEEEAPKPEEPETPSENQ